MRARTIGLAVGGASLALGITDILFGKSFGRGIGAGEVNGGRLFRSVGMREVATGLAGIARPESSGPIWTRFAADLGDMAALGVVISRPNPKRGVAALALGIVAGVAVADFLAARAIDRANQKSAQGDPQFAMNGE